MSPHQLIASEATSMECINEKTMESNFNASNDHLTRSESESTELISNKQEPDTRRVSIALDDVFTSTTKRNSLSNSTSTMTTVSTSNDESYEFSYGSFRLNLSKTEIVNDPTIFQAIHHTPQLQYDPRILQLKMRRASMALKAAVRFGTIT